MDRIARSAFSLATLVLAASIVSCGGKASQEELAQLQAENEALRTRLAEQQAEEDRTLPPPPGVGLTPAASSTKPAEDDWAWAETTPAKPAETPPSPVIQPAPQPKPQPKPQAPKPPSPPPEPVNRLERPEPEPEPVRMETVRAAAGTAIEVLTQGKMDSQTALVGDAVHARLDRDLLDPTGRIVLPAGTLISGTITEVQAAKKVKKKSKLAFQFDTATLADGSTVAIAAGRRLEGPGWDKKDGAVIGGSAAGGAVLGQILGGDSEATAAGAVLGGAIASGVLMSEKGEPTVVPDGAAIELVLQSDVVVERPTT